MENSISHLTMRLVALIGCCVLLNSGCATRKATLNDLMSARKKAGEAWVNEIKTEQDHETRLEGKLSLQDALSLAIQHNKKLQVVLQEHEIARGGVLKSYSAALPNLSANANYTKLDETPSFDVGNQHVSMGFDNNYSAGLTVKQPIAHGGAISAGLRAARFNALLSDEKIRTAVELTVFNASRAYFEVLLANQLLQVSKSAVKSSERYLSDVQKKKNQGVASEYNVLRAKVEVSNFRAELIKQKNAVNLAITKLLHAMGMSQESDIILTDKLEHQPVKPVFEEAIRIANEKRSDLYKAELRIRMQREALRIARSRFWPQVDAFFSQEWARPDPHSSTSDEWGDAWIAGAALSFPVFDGFNRYGKVVEESARLKQAEVNLVKAEESTFLEVKQAILDIKDAEEFVESQKMNLKHTNEGLRLVQVGYKEGINTEVEVMDAQTALTRSQALFYQAIYSHTLARLYLQKAMGILGPEPGIYTIPADPADPRNETLFKSSH